MDGPDDASYIVWAIGMFLISIIWYLFTNQTTSFCQVLTTMTWMYNDVHDNDDDDVHDLHDIVDDDSLDNATGIIWAIGMLFFYYSVLLTN